MKILFTGRGTSGSWKIRGVQLGQALGAHVEAMSTKPADIAVAVKRVPDVLCKALRGRLVWDVVDAFPQPHGNHWDEKECKHWLAREVERIKPIGLIAATQAMAKDCEAFGLPVLWLPHHYRPGSRKNPIRPEVKVIGYEGGPDYLRDWRPAIERECERIGATFRVNPDHQAELDIVLALRSATGYAARNWKSNVKLANAHGSGTPWIGCREGGYQEMACGAEAWADDPAQLRWAIESLMDYGVRSEISAKFLKAAFPLEAAAARLREWLKKCF